MFGRVKYVAKGCCLKKRELSICHVLSTVWDQVVVAEEQTLSGEGVSEKRSL